MKTRKQKVGALNNLNLLSGAMAMNHTYRNYYRFESLPRGTNMKFLGVTEDGREILQDKGGRKYTRDPKGTIRRLKE